MSYHDGVNRSGTWSQAAPALQRDELRTPLERKRWGWGFLLAGWILLSVVVVGTVSVSLVTDDKPVPWSRVISELLGIYLWALLFPLIWWVARRFPFERKRWVSRLAINLAIGVLLSSFYGLLALFKNQLILNLGTGQQSFQTLRQLPSYLLSSLEFFLAMYFAIVAGIHAALYYRKYHDRELKSSRLETQLARAQLDVLKMQLHPHFLFNTLNAISALMHRDVDAADRMITKLSDLLRLSLDKDDRHQVSLTRELEFLDHYVAIERIRFRDRLHVTVDIEPSCLDAQVPKMILQPLVENAIRHGIAMRSAAGHVELRGRRRGGRLRLEVRDDGPGLASGSGGLREGVGTANTRARLEQLYGQDHRFLLRNARGGGFEVILEIPFEVEERFPLEGVA